MSYKLTIELVPKTIWFDSIAQICKKTNQTKKWELIKKKIFETEGLQCWICGKEDTRLEAHEFWMYDDDKRIQKLTAIHHLCGLCHKIKHIGLWCHTERGKSLLSKAGLSRDDLIRHFCMINKCSEEDFEQHEQKAFIIFSQRSKYAWIQDFGEYDPDGSLKLFINSEK